MLATGATWAVSILVAVHLGACRATRREDAIDPGSGYAPLHSLRQKSADTVGSDAAQGQPTTERSSSSAASEAPLRSAPGAALLIDTSALVRWLETHNAGVMAQRARVAQAESDVGQSRLFDDPSLALGWGGINIGPRNPPDLPRSQSQNYTFGVSETFEIGKRGPRIEAARLRLDAERQRYQSLVGDTTGRARLALARAVFLRTRLGVLGESLDAAKQLLGVERSRLDHGDISRNDYDRLTLETTLLEIEMPKNKAELEGAMADVRTLLGSEATLDASDPDLLAKAGAFDGSKLDVDASITGRPDHAALTLDMQAAQKDALLAGRKAIPDPQVGVMYTRDRLTEAGNQADTMALTLGFELPIFDRGQHASRKAEDHALEIAHARDESVREAQAEATTLLERQGALDGVLRRLENEALPTSKQVLDATTTAFNRGELKLADVLLTQRTHIDLVLKRMDLEFESFSVRNDLRRVLGLDSAVVREVSRGK